MSDDLGDTWQVLDIKDKWPLPYARGLAIKADDPLVLFAGCGQATTGERGHVLRTTDYGQRWEVLALPTPANATLWVLPRIPPVPTASSRSRCWARCTSARTPVAPGAKLRVTSARSGQQFGCRTDIQIAAGVTAIEDNSMKDFSGRIAVVTGGDFGMGRELVRQLVAEGCAIARPTISSVTYSQPVNAPKPQRHRGTGLKSDARLFAFVGLDLCADHMGGCDLHLTSPRRHRLCSPASWLISRSDNVADRADSRHD